MKIYRTSAGEEKQLYSLLSSRAKNVSDDITLKVRAVIDRVRSEGDAALLDYCEKFDGVRPDSLCLDAGEIDRAAAKVSPELYAIMERAAANIRAYHEKQLSDGYVMKKGGKTLGRIVRPLKRVGVYVPAELPLIRPPCL